MKRSIAVILIALVLVTTVTVAQAQDKTPTLAQVWKTVQGMQSDFLTLALELRALKDRITEIEEEPVVTVLSPTPQPLGVPCVIVIGFTAISPMGHEMHYESQKAFLQEFETDTLPDKVMVTKVRLYQDQGILKVFYKMPDFEAGDNLTIIETWQGCKMTQVEFVREK